MKPSIFCEKYWTSMASTAMTEAPGAPEGNNVCDEENMEVGEANSPAEEQEAEKMEETGNAEEIHIEVQLCSPGVVPEASGVASGTPEAAKASSDAESPHKLHDDRPPNYTRNPNRPPAKFSETDLETILTYDSFHAFLTIMSYDRKFQNTVFEETKSAEMIILLILVLGKIHEVPLRHHLKDLANKIFGTNAVFRNHIMAYVNRAVSLEEQNEPNPFPRADQVWSSLETFCKYAKRFQDTTNCWIYCTRALCRILDGKTQKSLVKKHLLFTKLQDELAMNTFYEGVLYTSAENVKVRQEYNLPTITNGKFDGVKEFLDFHILHGRAFFLTPLFSGMEEYSQLSEEQKSGVILKDINGINIFPCVRIYAKYPPFMEMNKKLFLLDLAPRSRVDGNLPEEVKAEITSDELQLGNTAPLFLSTSPEFNDIIVALVPHVADEIRHQGFLIADILYMENIKECIFDRDLFLVTIPSKFGNKLFSLEFMEKISSATFPMKEFFLDCEESLNAPEEVAMSIEAPDEQAALPMNERQSEALKLALTKRLTIIHGPPATGKSSVLFNIVQCLLADPRSRILIVSDKNCTLDKMTLQFAKLTDKIVRIGTFFRNPDIEKFALKDIKRSPEYGRIRGRSYEECVFAKKDFVEAMESFGTSSDEEAAERVMKTFRRNQQITAKFDQIYRLWMHDECQNARILAITTSGTAKYHDLLELFRPTVVIFDEAAEVPETHLMTSLTEDVQRLIMAGDLTMQMFHQRLCSISKGIECSKLSLFARMIAKDVNCIRLNTQYRMHPNISDLFRGTLYDDLIDAENLKNNMPIRGIPKNVFCIMHENLTTLPDETLELLRKEFPPKEGTFESKEDFYQVLFCLGLACFLRQQGYEPQDIVLLTIFEDDMKAISPLLEHFPLLKGVGVYSSIAFQGRETRIAILWPGREQLHDDFVCITMTRAKEGLYIVESFNKAPKEEDATLPVEVKETRAWDGIKEKLRDRDAIGPAIPIKCEKHSCTMLVRGMEDFMKFNENGCPQATDATEKHPCLENFLKSD